MPCRYVPLIAAFACTARFAALCAEQVHEKARVWSRRLHVVIFQVRFLYENRANLDEGRSVDPCSVLALPTSSVGTTLRCLRSLRGTMFFGKLPSRRIQGFCKFSVGLQHVAGRTKSGW